MLMLLALLSRLRGCYWLKFHIFDNWNKLKSVVSTETCGPLVQILTTIGNLATGISRMKTSKVTECVTYYIGVLCQQLSFATRE